MQGLDEILAITVKRMNMSVFSVRDKVAGVQIALWKEMLSKFTVLMV